MSADLGVDVEKGALCRLAQTAALPCFGQRNAPLHRRCKGVEVLEVVLLGVRKGLLAGIVVAFWGRGWFGRGAIQSPCRESLEVDRSRAMADLKAKGHEMPVFLPACAVAFEGNGLGVVDVLLGIVLLEREVLLLDKALKSRDNRLFWNFKAVVGAVVRGRAGATVKGAWSAAPANRAQSEESKQWAESRAGRAFARKEESKKAVERTRDTHGFCCADGGWGLGSKIGFGCWGLGCESGEFGV